MTIIIVIIMIIIVAIVIVIPDGPQGAPEREAASRPHVRVLEHAGLSLVCLPECSYHICMYYVYTYIYIYIYIYTFVY